MIILKIIGWILLIITFIIVLLFIIVLIQDYGPRGKRGHIYSKMWFSFEMCAIVRKKNRGEISEEQEYIELQKEYFANKKTIDLYALIHENALNYAQTKWDMHYSSFQTHDENQTPLAVIGYWDEDFIVFSLNKIKEGVRPSLIARLYDKYLRRFF